MPAHTPEELAAAPADPSERRKYFDRLRQRKRRAAFGEKEKRAQRETQAAHARQRWAALSEEAKQAQREKTAAAAAIPELLSPKKRSERNARRTLLAMQLRANKPSERDVSRMRQHIGSADWSRGRLREVATYLLLTLADPQPQSCPQRGGQASAT